MKNTRLTCKVSVIAMTLLAIACGDKSSNDKGAMFTTPHTTNGQTTGGGDTTLKQIYIYSPDVLYTGGLGGRTGADGLCKLNLPTDLVDTFEAHALLNFSSLQTVAELQVSQAIPDVEIYAYGSNMKIADSWADLLDGTIDVTMADAGVLPANTIYWTGFNANGTTAQSYCNGFNNGTLSYSGQIGNSSYSDGRWSGFQEDACSVHYQILCVAFTQ